MLRMLSQYTPIELLIQTIINQYLSTSYCLTVVSEKPLDFPMNVSFTHISVRNGIISPDQLLEVSESGCSDYIVQVKQPRIFMDAFETVNQVGVVRRSDRKLVFLPYKDDEATTSCLLDVLLLNETGFVPNMLLILPALRSVESACSYYDLVTHNYVGQDNESHLPHYLDRWNSCTLSFEKNTNLFPHDMSDLFGKTVKVACFTYTPYVLLDIDRTLEPNGRYGTEVRIVDEFCSWINCTIEIVRDDEHLWGEILENRTGNGVIGNVVEDRADLGITALYSWYEEYLALDFSAPAIRTAITCIAPSPRLLASWEEPLLPFSWFMWLALLITFVYASFALAVAKGLSTDKVFLTTFGIMIAQMYKKILLPEQMVFKLRSLGKRNAWISIHVGRTLIFSCFNNVVPWRDPELASLVFMPTASTIFII